MRHHTEWLRIEKKLYNRPNKGNQSKSTVGTLCKNYFGKIQLMKFTLAIIYVLTGMPSECYHYLIIMANSGRYLFPLQLLYSPLPLYSL